MSRTGKKLISIPDNVKITLKQKVLQIEGQYGQLSYKIPQNLKVRVLDQNCDTLSDITEDEFSITNGIAKFLQLQTVLDDKKTRQCFGLSRTLINNMIIGVNEKFFKKLEMVGVGYKAQVTNGTLQLNVGFSHSIEMPIPDDIQVKIEKNVNIFLESINKEQIGLFSAKIRSLRPPEPYKGKGIKYADERIIRKAGKSAK